MKLLLMTIFQACKKICIFCLFFAIYVEAINCNDLQIIITFSCLMSKNTNSYTIKLANKF